MCGTEGVGSICVCSWSFALHSSLEYECWRLCALTLTSSYGDCVSEEHAQGPASMAGLEVQESAAVQFSAIQASSNANQAGLSRLLASVFSMGNIHRAMLIKLVSRVCWLLTSL
jgi:hypothetical protein